jgi:hypothetical protein
MFCLCCAVCCIVWYIVCYVVLCLVIFCSCVAVLFLLSVYTVLCDALMRVCRGIDAGLSFACNTNVNFCSCSCGAVQCSAVLCVRWSLYFDVHFWCLCVSGAVCFTICLMVSAFSSCYFTWFYVVLFISLLSVFTVAQSDSHLFMLVSNGRPSCHCGQRQSNSCIYSCT